MSCVSKGTKKTVLMPGADQPFALCVLQVSDGLQRPQVQICACGADGCHAAPQEPA